MVGAHILLMGSPGSGKSTFSDYLVKNDRFFHVCLGDILRKEVEAQTPNGLEYKKLLANGKLIPTATGIKIFEEYYKKGEEAGKRVIVDGLVQNEEYATYFKQFFTGKNVYFVYLKASREMCEMRLKKRQALEGRVDDQKPEVVNRRLDRFFNEAIKLVDHFRGESTFLEIDSNDFIENLKPLYRKLFIQPVVGMGYAVVDRITMVYTVFLRTLDVKKGEGKVVSWEDFKKLPPNNGFTSGGSSANVMKGLSMLGLNASFVGKTGRDVEGEFYKKRLEFFGVTPNLKTTDTPTCQVTCLITEDAQRTMLIFLGAGAEFTEKDLTLDQFPEGGHLHLDGYSLWNGKLFETALSMARKARMRISFDLGLESISKNQRERILAQMKNIDILFGNAEEMAALSCPKESACAVHVTKLGSEGAFVMTKERTFHSPGIKPKEVKDTTGAGDSFASGFLYGYLTNRSLEEAAAIGNHIASRKVEILGAEMPPEVWAELKEKIVKR